MNLRILYPRSFGTNDDDGPLDPDRFEPAVYDGGDHLPGAHVILDLSVNPPAVRWEYPHINYRFFAGLLPDTFVDGGGNLRSKTGEVVFWGRHGQQPEASDGNSPFYRGSAVETAKGWAIRTLKEDIASVISCIDPADTPVVSGISNYTQIFKSQLSKP